MMKRSKLFFLTSVLTMAGRIGGALIPFFIARYFATGAETDAFFLAYGFAIALCGLITPVFDLLLVPYLMEQKHSLSLLSKMANAILILSLPVLTLICFVSAYGLIPLLIRMNHFPPESSGLILQLFIELIPMVLLSIWIAVGDSLFYTHQSFSFPALSPALRTAIAVTVMALFHKRFGVHSIALGYFLGDAARLTVAYAVLFRVWGWRMEWNLGEVFPKVMDFFRSGALKLAGLAALSLTPLSDQWFAAHLGTGAVTLFSYADRLFQVPNQLFIAGAARIYLANWAEVFHQQQENIFWETARRDLLKASKIIAVISAVLILTGKPIVLICYGKALSASERENVYRLFIWLIAAFIPMVAQILFVRICFITKKAGVFCFYAWSRLGFNVLFNFIFSVLLGLQGIALSTFVTSLLMTGGIFTLNKKLRPGVGNA